MGASASLSLPDEIRFVDFLKIAPHLTRGSKFDTLEVERMFHDSKNERGFITKETLLELISEYKEHHKDQLEAATAAAEAAAAKAAAAKAAIIAENAQKKLIEPPYEAHYRYKHDRSFEDIHFIDFEVLKKQGKFPKYGGPRSTIYPPKISSLEDAKRATLDDQSQCAKVLGGDDYHDLEDLTIKATDIDYECSYIIFVSHTWERRPFPAVNIDSILPTGSADYSYLSTSDSIDNSAIENSHLTGDACSVNDEEIAASAGTGIEENALQPKEGQKGTTNHKVKKKRRHSKAVAQHLDEVDCKSGVIETTESSEPKALAAAALSKAVTPRRAEVKRLQLQRQQQRLELLWGELYPDTEDNDQYQLCIQAVQSLRNGILSKMRHVYLWIDYCCMDTERARYDVNEHNFEVFQLNGGSMDRAPFDMNYFSKFQNIPKNFDIGSVSAESAIESPQREIVLPLTRVSHGSMEGANRSLLGSASASAVAVASSVMSSDLAVPVGSHKNHPSEHRSAPLDDDEEDANNTTGAGGLGVAQRLRFRQQFPLSRVMSLCDAMLTPLYDADDKWELPVEISNYYEQYPSEPWNSGPAAYLNRSWCRLEMYFGSNVPILKDLPLPEESTPPTATVLATSETNGGNESNASSDGNVDHEHHQRQHDSHGHHHKKHSHHHGHSHDEMHQHHHNKHNHAKHHGQEEKHEQKDEDDKHSHEHGHHGHQDHHSNHKQEHHHHHHHHHHRQHPSHHHHHHHHGDNDDDSVSSAEDDEVKSGEGNAGGVEGGSPVNLHNSRRMRMGRRLQNFADFEKRPHLLFGSYEYRTKLPPIILPPLSNNLFLKYYPLDGAVSDPRDREKVLPRLMKELGDFQSMRQMGYDGSVNQDGEMHGKGTFTYQDGSTYEGEWRHGRKHGVGKLTQENGDIYDGEFKKDKLRGLCTYRYANGEKYFGLIKNYRRKGHGVMEYLNGDVYEGEFKRDKREGKGKIRYGRGLVYEGDFKNDMRHGKGVLRDNLGRKMYDGEWKYDEKFESPAT